MSVLACRGCGRVVDAAEPGRSACAFAGRDGGDHVIGRTLEEGVTFPTTEDENPFIRYRTLTHAYSVARAHGVTDAEFVAIVRNLDDAVKGVDGVGFRVTPLDEMRGLGSAIGLPHINVWAKDETHNVSGSHKGRHLMGLAILGETLERVGRVDSAERRPLAIASCGNAALAASAVARGWGRTLDVFVPTDANPGILTALERNGARVHACARVPGTRGDPCYAAFRKAVSAGATPFCCQGPDNGLTVEGGETLCWEMLNALAERRVALDRLFVQVGGGALASACIEAYRDAGRAGLGVRLPVIHPVQTQGAFPFQRAWKGVVVRALEVLGLDSRGTDRELADRLAPQVAEPAVAHVLDYAARHRSEFMRPWESRPSSLANGILDDETYDWLAIVRGTIASGGYPIVVGEDQLERANALARAHSSADPDETGSSGLAGLLEACRIGAVGATENVAIILSGVRR